MNTVVQCRAFTSKCRGKYTVEEIEELVETIGLNPRIGKHIQSAPAVFQYHWRRSPAQKHEYDVYYIFHSSSAPILIVNIFRRGEKNVLTKVLATMADEISKP